MIPRCTVPGCNHPANRPYINPVFCHPHFREWLPRVVRDACDVADQQLCRRILGPEAFAEVMDKARRFIIALQEEGFE